MTIEALVKDIGGAINNITSLFGGGSALYPSEIADRISNKIDENDKSWQKSLGYSFSVVRVSSGSVIEAEGWSDFTLQINPQELTQDEIFAIEVTPTYSGVLVEHQGITLKDISISGTTGLSPMRREGGAFPQSGRPVMAAGHSGYKEFHDLRTYIRTYVEQKRDDAGRSKGELRLVWRNLRDKEDLYVEPQKFSMKRSSSKPHLYDYSIQLKAIGIAKESGKNSGWKIDKAIEAAQDGMDSGLKIIQGSIGLVERVQRDIESLVLGPIRTYLAILQTIKTGEGRVNRAVDRVKSRTRSDKLKTAKKKINRELDIGKTIGGDPKQKEKLAQAKAEELNKENREILKAERDILNQKNLQITLDNVIKVYDNISDFLGVDSGAYGDLKGYISTLRGETANLSYDDLKVLGAFSKFKLSMYQLLKDNSLFIPTAKKDIDLINNVSAGSGEARSLSAALKVTENLKIKIANAKLAGDAVTVATAQRDLDTVERDTAAAAARNTDASRRIVADHKISKTITIEGGMTIQNLAAQELGDPDMYKEIALYNNLRPPYIDTTGTVSSIYVLVPGDKIQIPLPSSPASPTNVTQGFPAPINKNLDAVQKSFGVDFKLTDEFDLDVNSYGEINMSASSENVAQRIILRLLMEEGSLKRHKDIGVGLGIGRKSTLDLTALVERVRVSLSRDSSIEKVIYVDISQAGSSININLILKLRNVDQPLTFPVKVA